MTRRAKENVRSKGASTGDSKQWEFPRKGKHKYRHIVVTMT